MKYLATLLLIFGFGLSAYGQTIKSLGYNTTNGQVVANTGTNVLTFTNNVNFANGALAFNNQVVSGSAISIGFEDGAIIGDFYMDGGNILFSSALNAATTRANLGFSTNLNTLWTATNAASARASVGLVPFNGENGFAVITDGSENPVIDTEDGMLVYRAINFTSATNSSATRTNLGLGGGITTNRTFVSYNGTNYTTNTVTISNGIITGWTQ